MDLRPRKLAPYGLVLSGLGLLAAGVFYILHRSFDLGVQISLGVVALGIALAVLLDPGRARAALTGRQARYGSNALVMTLAFTGILVVMNFLVYKNPVRWDMTQDREFTLSKETVQILESLPEPVTVEAFFTAQYPSETASKLLSSYKYASKGKLDYQFIDPVQNPVEAQAAKVTRDGTIVLKMGQNQEQITYADEQDISAALLKLANPGERAVYFLTGHGEYSLDSSGDYLYTTVRATLENKNYTVQTLNLAASPKVPENARAVIVAGARKPLTDAEVASLKTYQEAGGALVVLSEPNLDPSNASQKDPLADYLLSAWGIQLDNDLIIDPQVNPPVVAVADPAQYGQHPITQKLQQMTTLFPSARSLQIKTSDPSISVETLIQTYSTAWGETDLAGVQQSQLVFDPAKDLQGPLVLAAAGTNNTTRARLVVIGDADFASDTEFGSYANGDVIVNTVDWAAEQENLLNLTPKTTTQRVMLPPQNFSTGLVFLLSVILTPGAILAAGILTWLQRRRRG